jgi:hypothetical protein
MAEDQTQALSLKAAYDFGKAHGLEREVSEIRDMVIEWDLSYTSSLRRGYIVELFERKDLFEQFKREHWTFGNTPAGERKRSWYLRIKARYEAFLSGNELEPEGERADEQPPSDASLEFALEAHLRDFLAKNLDRIEQGLRLHSSPENRGVEYPVDGGRIDILAVDWNGKYVVIELKLSQGRNKALGQLLYYMGWVDQRLGNGPCRGFIIASEITEDLTIAVARVPGVSLAKYKMNFAIEPVAV